jgi:hypothetical protein
MKRPEGSSRSDCSRGAIEIIVRGIIARAHAIGFSMGNKFQERRLTLMRQAMRNGKTQGSGINSQGEFIRIRDRDALM